MIINEEVLRTMNYVKETSARTLPATDILYSCDFQRDKTYFFLDYSDIPPQAVILDDDEF